MKYTEITGISVKKNHIRNASNLSANSAYKQHQITKLVSVNLNI
jgi:hypothetical protein